MPTRAELDLARQIAKYYDDPLGYVMFSFPWDTDESIQQVKLQEPWKTQFGVEYGPDKWACEFLESVGEEVKARAFNGKDAVPALRFTTASGHGIGKSVMVAWIIKWLMDTRPFVKGVVTANSAEQLKTKTWSELAKWHAMSVTANLCTYTNSRGSMSFYRNGTKDITTRWRFDAIPWKKENSEAFAGMHNASSTTCYIFDEASAIDDSIFQVREGGLTDGEPMVFDFGNPTRKSGAFYENCIGRNRHRYKVRKVDSREVQITNKEQIKEWAEDWGEDSDFFKVRVRGEFPAIGYVQFISSDLVDGAMRRPTVEPQRTDPFLIGVDVARYGDDETVIYPRIGNDCRSFGFKRLKGLDNVQVAEKVIETLQEFQRIGRKCNGLYIDGGGHGSGVVDILRRLGYNPIDVGFGTKASDAKYRYKGDEIWGRMRDAMAHLMLPSDITLRDQITQREYSFLGNGKLHLESKDDMKNRGLASPDIADALALTWASPPAMDIMDLGMASPLFTNHEYDPLEARF